MTNYQALVEQRYELRRQIKPLQDALEALDQEIKDCFLPGEPVYGSNGIGYQVSVTKKLKFNDDAKEFLAELGPEVLKAFVSISTSGLEKAKKAGLIETLDIAALENMATAQEVYTIRDVVNEEAKVFA